MHSLRRGIVLKDDECGQISCLTLCVVQGKSWDERWFVLTSSTLTYYRSQEDRDWGGAGTVLSLSSLKRFESLSSLVFQVRAGV